MVELDSLVAMSVLGSKTGLCKLVSTIPILIFPLSARLMQIVNGSGRYV